MKTTVYTNVLTGESFDSSGILRTENNPFSASLGEQRVIEWRLVSESSAADPAEWPLLDEYEYVPSIASVALDNNFIHAYAGTLSSPVEADSTTVSLLSRAEKKNLSPSGLLRLFRNDGTRLEIVYRSFYESSGVYLFTLETPPGESFAENVRADIVDIPLAKSSIPLEGSVPASGIFLFRIAFSSGRLSNLFDYEDLGILETKGLELKVAGLDADNRRVELIHVRIPFRITGILDSDDGCTDLPVSSRPALESWTLALFARGFETQYSADGVAWTQTAPPDVHAFRFRPAGLPFADWSSAVPLRPAEFSDYSFTAEEGNVETVISIPFSSLGRTIPFSAALLRLQPDGSWLDISSSAGIHISFSTSGLSIQSFMPLPAGSYRIVG